MDTRRLPLLISFISMLLWHQDVLAQQATPLQEQVVQVSGKVVAGDSLSGLEGVAVFVPGTTRGTHTRKSGYFSMPVVAGDTIVFDALGYSSKKLVIPADESKNSLTVKVVLEEQPNPLPVVEVMPWATEYDLKQALLRTKLPKDSSELIAPLPPPVVYKSITNMPAMDANANFKHGLNQQQGQRESRFKVPDILKVFSIPIRYY
ncbi:carboxypeptidase-like regulatory domain-containing protein [Pontibacter roseus]|uniref:carboxypeptidase-like regulatory domain-containing protein n=1 Tax=Pontibacter roseus TaxID=336989 RepID=UPI0003762B7D|nr:carboxypeptidase-like regulatory domain-containing protein [Pontibacter roseus]